MFGIVVFVVGFLIGFPIAHYTSYLINNSEDCQEKIEFKPISIRTTILCFIGGGLWLTIYMIIGLSIIVVAYLLATSILLAISVVDFAVYEIPPQFNIALAILGLICMFCDLSHWYTYVIGAFTVSGVFFMIALVTKGSGMGGGDIKLMAAAGFLLGWQKIFFVMVIGAILGIIIHTFAMAMFKKKSMLAFGPYLSMGVYIMMIFGETIVNWYINTFFVFYG